MTPTDCLRVSDDNGRNLTPVPILNAAHAVMGRIELDPASDSVAQMRVCAQRYYTLPEDGFSKEWEAKTVWLNPPGRTVSIGPDGERRFVTGTEWFHKLYKSWLRGSVREAMYLCYRAGSAGSLREGLKLPLCFTTRFESWHDPCINGAGRLSFEKVVEDKVISEANNTQSSIILYMPPADPVMREERLLRFEECFKLFGVVRL